MPAPRARPAAALAAVLLLAACATIPVSTDYDETVEFLFYRTVAVVPQKARDGRDRVESLTASRVREALVEGLAARGLAEAPRGEADLWARWRLRYRERVVAGERFPGPFWHRDRRLAIYTVRQGTLTVELVDRVQGRVVWKGSAAGLPDDAGRDTLRRVVAAILEKYPPMHEGP
jgi:hypothetical protein